MRVIKVQGRGNVSAEPDMVTLSFDVEATAREYAECLGKLNKRVDDLRSSMSASGLEKAKLKTSSYNVNINHKYKDGRYIFLGYIASHHLSIEFPLDKTLLNEVLHHVAQGHSGAQVHLSFSVKDKDALRKKALAQAVQSARENAETLAETAGVTLGKLLQMD